MKFLLIVFIAIFYTGCTHMRVDKFIPSNNRFHQNINQTVDSFVLPLLHKNNNIGVVVGTLYKNKTDFFTYGYLDNEKKIPMHKDTFFALGSNTKTLVKSLILILEDKGLIDLNETIGNIFPSSIKYKDNDVKNITLKKLILHSSGLPREPYDLATLKAILKYFVPKGSIAVNGISLTVAEVGISHFKVSIIPQTARETNLLSYKPNDKVNLECDLVGKYIERFMLFENQNADISRVNMDFLRENGFA